MMMIGPPGAGKSSYVNTARAVFSNAAWMEDAAAGGGAPLHGVNRPAQPRRGRFHRCTIVAGVALLVHCTQFLQVLFRSLALCLKWGVRRSGTTPPTSTTT